MTKQPMPGLNPASKLKQQRHEKRERQKNPESSRLPEPKICRHRRARKAALGWMCQPRPLQARIQPPIQGSTYLSRQAQQA